METIKELGLIWKSLVVVGTIAAAVYSVDARYVTNTGFSEFKEGTIVALTARLDRIEAKLDALLQEKRH